MADEFVGKQDSVGIRHRSYCVRIVDHVQQSLSDNSAVSNIIRPASQKLTLCVEGNISTGKSSFLQLVRDMQGLQVYYAEHVLTQ